MEDVDNLSLETESDMSANDLKTRIDNLNAMYRYKNVEPRYMSTKDRPTKDLDDYFINL